MVTIRTLRVEEVDATTNTINRLLQQLRPGVDRVGAAGIAEELKDPKHVQLFVVEDKTKKGEDAIVGMATVIYFWKLTRPQVEIHDVVLAEAYRGQGIGRQLMERVIASVRARAQIEKKQINIKLTSRPERVAGNALYQKMGFTMVAKAEPGERGTNLYELKITPR